MSHDLEHQKLSWTRTHGYYARHNHSKWPPYLISGNCWNRLPFTWHNSPTCPQRTWYDRGIVYWREWGGLNRCLPCWNRKSTTYWLTLSHKKWDETLISFCGLSSKQANIVWIDETGNSHVVLRHGFQSNKRLFTVFFKRAEHLLVSLRTQQWPATTTQEQRRSPGCPGAVTERGNHKNIVTP